MAVSQILSVTEVAGSVNNSNNTSKVRILWQSTQTGESWNGYTKTAKYFVSINGGAEKEYSVSYTLPKASTATIVDTTITVAHKNDGSGTVSVRTWMDTGISAGVVEKSQSINLTTIPRASTISYAANLTLGNACTIQWTPQSKDFRFKIKFSLGSWSYTTGVIHPNTTAAYAYTGYTIPLDVANQITGKPPTGSMTATLYTYSNSGATTQVGAVSTKTFTVTVPDNSNTKPTIAMSLSPVTSLGNAFSGLYIQGKTKVKASFTGSSAKYGASISSYSMAVSGLATYASPYQSDWLSKSGTVTVKGTAYDSRGFSSFIETSINVIAYSKPSVIPHTGEKSVVCKRCDSTGKITPSGTYLRIKAGRWYRKVIANGVQKNFCLLRYRYKTEGATNFSDWVALITKATTSTDEVDVILESIVTSTKTSYVVQIGVADDIEESPAPLEFSIPTDSVDVHLRKGGKGVGIGKYSEVENVLDIADDWDVWGRVYSLGKGKANIPNGADLNNYKEFGVYNVRSNDLAVTLSNCPSSTAGVLIVSSSNGGGTNSGQWVYILQKYITYDGRYEYFRYMHTEGVADEWIYSEWGARSDTQWMSLGLSGNVTVSERDFGRHTNGGCYYRVVNENHVYVAFNCAFTYKGSGIIVNTSAIPEKYRPKRTVFSMCAAGVDAFARVDVTTAGNVVIDWAKSLATAEATTSFTGTWVDGYIDYWI